MLYLFLAKRIFTVTLLCYHLCIAVCCIGSEILAKFTDCFDSKQEYWRLQREEEERATKYPSKASRPLVNQHFSPNISTILPTLRNSLRRTLRSQKKNPKAKPLFRRKKKRCDIRCLRYFAYSYFLSSHCLHLFVPLSSATLSPWL